MTLTLVLTPDPVIPGGSFDAIGTGYDRKKFVYLNGVGPYKPDRKGSFKIGMKAPMFEGPFVVNATYRGSLTVIASATLTVAAVVPWPPPDPVPFPWASLQAAINAVSSGDTIDATGRTFYEQVTINKAVTILGGTIDGQGIRQLWADVVAADVFLDGMTFLNAASGPVQTGSLSVSAARFHWRNGKATGGCYASLRPWVGATDALIENCDISGKEMGVVAYNAHNLHVTGGKIHDARGTQDIGWESGGIKVGASTGVVIDGVDVYMNVGPGIWLDVYCSGAVVQNCHAHDNTRSGIMVELQDGGTVQNNVVNRNANGAIGGNAFESRAGIFVSSSKNITVTGNTVAWNGPSNPTVPAATDITVLCQDRELSPHNGNVVTGNILRSAVAGTGFFTDHGEPSTAATLTPNTRVADTDPRIVAIR